MALKKPKEKDSSKKVVGVIIPPLYTLVLGDTDIVYNKGVSTILILDNSITAMTGHQDNPSTGRTIKGNTAALDQLPC